MKCNYSILIILPYFGRFSNYFNLWLDSVAYNSSIDFLLITDNREHRPYPPNVRVKYMDFPDLVNFIQSKFDFNISLETSYKLCDFKPTYGYLFSDFLEGYDFWGHCDCDLIFGDIRKFVTDEVLDKYDRVFEFGHLCFYRNTEDVNLMFQNKVQGVRFYKNVLSSTIIQCFDESCGMTPIWDELCPDKVFREVLYDDIHYMKYLFFKTNDMNNSNIYRFFKGHLYRVSMEADNHIVYTEICYVHFQKRNMINTIDIDHDGFIAVPNRFIADCEITQSFFRRWNRNRFYGHPLIIRYKSLISKAKNKLLRLKKR